MTASSAPWRPLHRRLGDEAVELMAKQRANGGHVAAVHLALTTDESPQPFRTACDPAGCPGEWITGDVAQVTCDPCRAQAHA
jgi:hypothetical protein